MAFTKTQLIHVSSTVHQAFMEILALSIANRV